MDNLTYTAITITGKHLLRLKIIFNMIFVLNVYKKTSTCSI